MPVPTLVTDLSTTLASNSPSGSDNVFPSLDDYLRALSGFVASIRDNSGNGWVSPYLPLAGGTVTGATTFSSTVALNGALSGTGLTTYLASPPAIGGTTPNTGAFTTLAASSDLTLSGGTANGVLYLNGSKVATSGTALAFDGNRLTVSSATPSIRLDDTNTTGAFGIDWYFSSLALQRGNISLDGSTGEMQFQSGASGSAGYFQTFLLNGSEQMRLTSTGLGIGTSSPGARLHSLATTNPAIFASSDATALFTTYQYDTSTVCGYIGNGAGVVTGAGASNFGVRAENSLVFAAGGNNERMRLDSSGNLVLNGTTAGASSVGTFTIFNGTAPTGSVTDGVILFAQDISSSSELRVRDEAGNVTTLSPHNFSLIPEGPSEDMAWAYYSEKGGKRINVDMLKLARMVEKLTGEKLVYEV